MRWPRFTRSLHFRLSASFLGLMAVLAVGCYFWIRLTVLRTDRVPGQERYYDELARAELDSLARLLAAGPGPVAARCDSITRGYLPRIEHFDSELTLIAPDGTVLASTRPDSLSKVLLRVSPALLDSMTRPGWDFESYPNKYDIDAFENRIFAVAPVAGDGGDDGRLRAWLVGSFRPLNIEEGEFERAQITLVIQAGVVILVFAACSMILVMAGVTRRLQVLSASLAAFREGRFDRRVETRSADEIGQLSRDYNAMADRISALIEELRRSEEFHRQLVANISHDLRTPLSSLRGYVETLALRGDTLPPHQRARYLGVLESNVDVLENLIGRMLELSRLDSGRAEFRLEEFRLPELCHEVLARCESIAASRGVTLRCVEECELPPVRADALRIGQVLQNLVENGIKFNREGGSVVVSGRLVPGGVRIEVRDTGRGIAAEHLPHIFDRFYTADPSRGGESRGSGLGLAIAARILEGHGSRIEVDSVPGEGAAFRFVLPLADPGA